MKLGPYISVVQWVGMGPDEAFIDSHATIDEAKSKCKTALETHLDATTGVFKLVSIAVGEPKITFNDYDDA